MKKSSEILSILLLFGTQVSFAQSNMIQIPPQNTDPEITVDVIGQDTLRHQVFFGDPEEFNDKLLVFLPGTGGRPDEHYSEFCTMAALLGYRSIGLVYKNSVSISDICGTDSTTDENCSENARTEIVYGENLSDDVDVNMANSIVNRLQKLLFRLETNYGFADWSDFLINDEIDWSKIILAGHSQGGGHAALLARDFSVARVIFFNSPSDRNNNIDTPHHQPPWFYEERATSDENYYAFYHQQNGGPERLAIYEMLGLTTYGDAQNVDILEPPYAFSHVLFTDSTTFDYEIYDNPSCSNMGYNPHSDIIVDCEVPMSSNGFNAYEDAWIHLLTNEESIVSVRESGHAANDLLIFPNPASDFLRIKYNGTPLEVLVYDQFGKVVLRAQNAQIDTHNLVEGVYTLGVKFHNAPYQFKKLVIAR